MRLNRITCVAFFIRLAVSVILVSGQQQCNICGTANSTLRGSHVPSDQLSRSEVPPFLTDEESSNLLDNRNMTCQDWQSYINQEKSTHKFVDIAHRRCLTFQNWLRYSCCDGIITPLFECQRTVIDKLLTSTASGIPYNKEVAPSFGNSRSEIEVYVNIHISNYSIINYGVDGGAIEIDGWISSKWTDKQLVWNPIDVGGCTLIRLKASYDPDESDIWVPTRGTTVKSGSPSSRAFVLADGSVFWTRKLNLDLACSSVPASERKLCKYTLSTKSGTLWDGDGVKYIIGSPFGEAGLDKGISANDPFAIPGYELNRSLSKLTVYSDKKGNNEVTTTVVLDPLETDCLLCSGIDGATLRHDTVPLVFNNANAKKFAHIKNYTCQQINDYMLDNSVGGSHDCEIGKRFFSESCCDGLPSRSECENNVRNQVLEKFGPGGTVVPPDTPRGVPMVDVEVRLHFSHILDIDIKSNTLEALISLELIWEDERTGWDSFIGQCSAVSFRASLDPEQTEIWVPELDLMNQVEGITTFPPSFITAFSELNLMWWRRTGVVKVACDLKGVKYFPFDHPVCSMEFGAPRSPLAHRVHYSIGSVSNDPVEFSDRLIEQSGKYQTYHVDVTKTKVSRESETLALYNNEFIRFTFVFDRAIPYYIWSFVVLYILFTYLAFGMFFLDQQVGERLGYGTGILFVIVAQDITVAEHTPVTNEQLWINKVSFGSKMFVVFSIVQSVVILHYYFVNDLDGDGIDNDLSAEQNETESFINVDEDDDIDGEEIYHSEVGRIRRRKEKEIRGSIEENEKHHNPNTPKSKRKISGVSSFLIKHILGYKVRQDDSLTRKKVLKLRVWDKVTAIFFFVAYTIFIVVMFSVGMAKAGED